jgi:hypothetical protein
MKPVAATTQNVTVIADAKSGKATLQFEKKGDSLVSKTKLPEGEGYNVVVQFKQTAEVAVEPPVQSGYAYLWRVQARRIRLHLRALIAQTPPRGRPSPRGGPVAGRRL